MDGVTEKSPNHFIDDVKWKYTADNGKRAASTTIPTRTAARKKGLKNRLEVNFPCSIGI